MEKGEKKKKKKRHREKQQQQQRKKAKVIDSELSCGYYDGHTDDDEYCLERLMFCWIRNSRVENCLIRKQNRKNKVTWLFTPKKEKGIQLS